MNPDDNLAQGALWIWAPGARGPNHYVEFEFDLPHDAISARIQLSAETSLRLWVNDKWVHAGPPREVSPYFYFDTIDLSPRLQPGSNTLRIIAHHQGRNSQSYHAGTPSLLVGGSCITRNGTTVDFADPTGWRARRLARYRADAHRLFSCIGFSEFVDFAAEEPSWGRVCVVASHPWEERPVALPRDLPCWREIIREPIDCVACDNGWMIDMGVEVSGYVELALEADSPIALCVSYAEALTDGRVDSSKAQMDYRDQLLLVVGETIWRSYEKRAFRFLHLDQPLSVRHVRVIEYTWPYDPLWKALPHDESEEGNLVRLIRQVSARTIELNTEDLFTDCPWRERAQYLDCQFSMGAMKCLFGTLAPIERFLRQFPRGADETGLLRMCYPSPGGTTVIPDFSMSYAVLLLRYLDMGGNLDLVRRNLSFAERGVTAFRGYEDGDGLLVDVPGWIFLDNTFELPKFPRSAGLNAVYHGALCALAELHRRCGRSERRRDFVMAADRLRCSFRKVFLRGGRLLDSDSTPEHEAYRQWVYHHGSGVRGDRFRLCADYRKRDAQHPLRLAVHGAARVWVDGTPVAVIQEGGSWARSAIYQPAKLTVPADTDWHRLELEVEWNGIDWECYLSCMSDVEWRNTCVAGRPVELRGNPWPWMTQVTVGYSACHGLLEPDEARTLLRTCLAAQYEFPYAKRTTPFFATIGDRGDGPRILPCNVPASMFHFCHALKLHGMAKEARDLLLPIYRGMLERGATTWWEEWNTGSSLCHAWGSFVVEFLDQDVDVY